MDPVVHFELPADDMERAMKFYGQTFGWELNRPPGIGFAFAKTTAIDPKTFAPKEPARINGSLLTRQSVLQHPVVTIKVADLDAALAKAQANGAKVALPKRDVGPVLSAYLEDTEGNIIGLVQDKTPRA
ncbi:MAG: VOC family protein [Candidatus Thermoplasmatota archaeon]